MTILTVTLRALKETFTTKRTIPFFLLNIMLALATFVFLMPLANLLFKSLQDPSAIEKIFSEIGTAEIIFVALNSFTICLVAAVAVGINIWFIGALVYDVASGKGFERGLKYSRRFYLRLLSIYAIVFLISSLSLWFATIPFGGLLQTIISFLVSWILLFPIPTIIMKKDSADFAIMRSMSLINSFKLDSLLFLFLTYFVRMVIFFIPIAIAVLLFPAPFVSVLANMPNAATQPVSSQTLSIAYSLLTNYTAYLIFSAALSFSFAISTVFIYTAKTYYFMELIKRKFAAL